MRTLSIKRGDSGGSRVPDMKPVLVASLLLVSTLHVRAVEMDWSPMWDVETLSGVLTPSPIATDNPDLIGGYSGNLPTRINSALGKAHANGITILNIPFLFNDSIMNDPARTGMGSLPKSNKDFIKAYGMASRIWVTAIDGYNQAHPAAKFDLRIRIPMYCENLYYYDHYSKNRVAGLPTSFIGGLCAMDPSGTWAPEPALDNPLVRQAIGNYTGEIIGELRSMAPHTKLVEVILSYDYGKESTLQRDPVTGTGITGFPSQPPYPESENLETKARWFNERENYLTQSFKAFADAVHGKSVGGVNLAAGIFSQIWTNFGSENGAFDAYRMLRGTGIDILHYSTQTLRLNAWWGPQNPANPPMTESDFAKSTLYTHSITKRLSAFESRSMNFNSEFSWNWYHLDGAGNESMAYKGSYSTPGNAQCFRSQANVAARYGAPVIMYGNWSRYDIDNGLPRATGAYPTPSDPSGKWPQILSATAKASITNGNPPFANATKAILVSTYGRISYEVGDRSAASPGLQAYWRAFQDFGLAPENYAVDIITDQMLLDNPNLFDQYNNIYLPYETSKAIGFKVRAVLNSLSSTTKTKFRYKKGPNSADPIVTGVSDYLDQAKIYVDTQLPSILGAIN